MLYGLSSHFKLCDNKDLPCVGYKMYFLNLSSKKLDNQIIPRHNSRSAWRILLKLMLVLTWS